MLLFKKWSSGVSHHVLWWKYADVLEEPASWVPRVNDDDYDDGDVISSDRRNRSEGTSSQNSIA
jgi:hypothetical protein